MNIFLRLCIPFIQTYELSSECTNKCDSDKQEVRILYAYYVYELIFKTKEYRQSQIYRQYYKKTCDSTIKKSFFEQTHSIIVERLSNKFNELQRVTLNNIYHIPMEKFIKANNKYLNDCDTILMENLPKKIDENYDHFVNSCISNYIDIVVNEKILKSKEMYFFNKLVQIDKEGFYVHKSKPNYFIYKKNFNYENMTSNSTTEKEIKTKRKIKNEPENIAYFKILNLSIINFHMYLYVDLIAMKTKPGENIYLADKISKLEFKFDNVLNIFNCEQKQKDEELYKKMESRGTYYEYFDREKDEKLKRLLDSYFYHLYKMAKNAQELIKLSTDCIMKQNTDFYAECIVRFGFRKDKIYIYLIKCSIN